MNMVDFDNARHEMVQRQLIARGVRDPLVLKAMGTIPRESFVPPNQRALAYSDMPLPIGDGQTISQPYIVAFMIEALTLKGGESVLEIGTGSGYADAVLSQVAGEVYTIERVAELAETAIETLSSLGCHNVHVLQGDGTLGWPEHSPFDAIVVSAGGPRVPESLRSQLKIGGRMVMPVGSVDSQELVRVKRVSEDEFKSEVIANVRFVPLIGDEGWDLDHELNDSA